MTMHRVTMDSVLRGAGLTGNEERVYLALLESGSAPAGALIKRVGMHRAAVYDTLDALTQKGLVSFILSGRTKLFQAEDPQRLLGYIEDQKEELSLRQEDLQRSLPELRNLRSLSASEQEGTLYTGRKGLKAIFEDLLMQGKPWLVFGATGKFKTLFPLYFVSFHRRRCNRRITMRVLFTESVRAEKRGKELKLCRIRYLPQQYVSPATTYVYADKVAIIIWSPDPFGVVIRNKEVAESYGSFFELLWGIGTA